MADQEYLLYCLHELHQSQARMSWMITPPFTPREAAMREVLDRLVETIDAMTGYMAHLETGEPLRSPFDA